MTPFRNSTVTHSSTPQQLTRTRPPGCDIQATKQHTYPIGIAVEVVPPPMLRKPSPVPRQVKVTVVSVVLLPVGQRLPQG